MKKTKRQSFLSGLGIAVLLSAVLSAFIISAVNDAFAFSKTGEEAEITVSEADRLLTVAKNLKKLHVIRYPLTFCAYSALRGGMSLSCGNYTVSGGMSYDEIRSVLSPRRLRKQIKITIPEGYTTAQIVSLFCEKGFGTEQSFYDVIENYPFDFDFLSDIPSSSRKYRLDGYLFPDTYYFYEDSDEAEALSKMLAGFDRRFSASMRERALEMGMSVDEVVILASVVQAEAYFHDDMPGVAAVFENRLHSSYRYLESDATASYYEPASTENTDNPYDTYKKEGLPAGPICNPGLDALSSVLFPASSDALFFVCAPDKSMIFSKTYEEHRGAIASLSQ